MKKSEFQRIAVMGREGVEGVPDTLKALGEHLLSRKNTVVFESNAANMIDGDRFTVIEADEIKKHADLLIVVGGDGSMLSASRIAVAAQLPVLGINRGRLGFLTDIRPNEFNKIDAILDGHYREEHRFLLTASIEQNQKQSAHDLALNDVVLLPGDVAKMIEFEVIVNDERVCSQRADGLIVATPTGSTAYALSGGGPILHPQLDAVVLVPMFPHTLSSRPIVLQGNSQIKIVITKDNDTSPYVSCDGQNRVAVSPGGCIQIEKNKQQLHLIHPEDYDYYETLRRKLDWEKRAVRV